MTWKLQRLKMRCLQFPQLRQPRTRIGCNEGDRKENKLKKYYLSQASKFWCVRYGDKNEQEK